MKTQIEMNRIENQDEIDNDYSRCKECGNILHDLCWNTQVCDCVNGSGARDLQCGTTWTPFGERVLFGRDIIDGIYYGKGDE